MTRNRRLLLGGLIAAVLLLAVPAMALGAVWKHKGANLAKFVEIGLTGGEIFETTAGNGMSCETTATMTTEGGSTAKITKFTVVKCPTGFGSFAGCTVKATEAKGLPWTVEVNATDLTIKNMRVKRTFNGGCAEIDKTITSTTVTLNTQSAISEMEFSGSTTGYKVFGSFTVNAPNAGTYGIG